MNWFLVILFLLAGGYCLIVIGLLGKGIIGNTKKMAERLGTGITRLIYTAVGIGLIMLGVAGIVNPGLFGN